MNKNSKLALIVLLSCLLLNTSSVYAKSGKVIFVTKVSKKCKHLGSIFHSFEDETLYKSNEGFRVISAGPVFATAMKAKAKKMGANRLVLVEVFNDKKIMSGMGYHEWITKSQFRARAFKCK